MADVQNTGLLSKLTGAIGAYGSTAKLGGDDTASGGSFGDMVMGAIKQVADTQKKAESVEAKALQGKASVTDVVQAVSEAELTLQTFTAVRDRFISAYQDIMRMPV